MQMILLPTSIFLYAFTNRSENHATGNHTLGYTLFPLLYLMPNCSYAIILQNYLVKGAPSVILGLNVNTAWTCLVLSIPFYLMLYMYLDAIIPNAYGIRE